MKISLSVIIIISLLHSITPHSSIHITHHLGSESDKDALLAIKSKISLDPNLLLGSWNESLPLCKWHGVTCGRRHRRVVGLDLSSSSLNGTLSPAVGNLSFLRNLTLHKNTFQGGIPSEIGYLSRLLSLGLGNNSFQGEIPVSLSRCVHLRVLVLSYNNLVGKIPVELSSLLNLKWLRLSSNNLSGSLEEAGITNMTSLEKLTLEGNHFEGNIPLDIGHLKGLTTLYLGENRLSGMIPPSLFNLSSLKFLQLSNNGIHGQLPHDLGLLLPNLQFLHIRNNFFDGSIPKSLSNLSELEQIDISNNKFTGKFLFSGQNMQNLQWINMMSAFSWGDEANDLSFLETLTNCSNLEYLEVGINDFGGMLPNAIVNLSTNLKFIALANNRISGSLPSGLSKFVQLQGLLLYDNQFTGPIPAEIGELKSLEVAIFAFNNFSGNVPSSLGNLSLLSDLRLSNNNLVGHIPSSLGRCKYLLHLYLAENKISGVLPPDLFYASQLFELVIGENHLQGPLPVEISNLKNLVTLDVSENMFSGEIPSTLGSCTSLDTLYMGGNAFSGSIPLSLSSLKNIQQLDLSQNNLSGQIPSFFSELPLLSLGLSFNSFEGEVPVKGIFSNVTAVSLDGNRKLCGGVPELHFPRCPSQREPKRRKVSSKMLKVIISSSVLITAVLLALLLYFLCSKRKMKQTFSESLDMKGFLEASYKMLWEATEGFSSSNLIGVGGFGSVYKGIIRRQGEEQMQVAIKVLNLENERASKSMISECKALRNIRHRNLVKIITVCSSLDHQRNDFKALVYEFMSRGSLDSWIHSDQSSCLSLAQRLSIAIDVACAIDYLHNGCPTPIIHCDLKPSNILLDDELTAHVGDFGLAKFLLGASGTANQASSSQVRGTVGYTAPEYGVGSKVSAEGDVYSFGIIVLETITSKKPTDPTFNQGLNLGDFARSALPNGVIEIVDPRLMDDDSMRLARSNADIRKIECIRLLISIGIQCSLELPQERMQIKEVVNQLKLAKQNLLGRRF